MEKSRIALRLVQPKKIGRKKCWQQREREKKGRGSILIQVAALYGNNSNYCKERNAPLRCSRSVHRSLNKSDCNAAMAITNIPFALIEKKISLNFPLHLEKCFCLLLLSRLSMRTNRIKTFHKRSMHFSIAWSE